MLSPRWQGRGGGGGPHSNHPDSFPGTVGNLVLGTALHLINEQHLPAPGERFSQLPRVPVALAPALFVLNLQG